MSWQIPAAAATVATGAIRPATVTGLALGAGTAD
jgi:hypothetical protein